jgi:hypothetical protein
MPVPGMPFFNTPFPDRFSFAKPPWSLTQVSYCLA